MREGWCGEGTLRLVLSETLGVCRGFTERLWSTYCVCKGLRSVEAWVCFLGMYSI